MAPPEQQQSWVLPGYDISMKELATEAVMAPPSE
jgi:hypothetical protein